MEALLIFINWTDEVFFGKIQIFFEKILKNAY